MRKFQSASFFYLEFNIQGGEQKMAVVNFPTGKFTTAMINAKID